VCFLFNVDDRPTTHGPSSSWSQHFLCCTNTLHGCLLLFQGHYIFRFSCTPECSILSTLWDLLRFQGRLWTNDLRVWSLAASMGWPELNPAWWSCRSQGIIKETRHSREINQSKCFYYIYYTTDCLLLLHLSYLVAISVSESLFRWKMLLTVNPSLRCAQTCNKLSLGHI